MSVKEIETGVKQIRDKRKCQRGSLGRNWYYPDRHTQCRAEATASFGWAESTASLGCGPSSTSDLDGPNSPSRLGQAAYLGLGLAPQPRFGPHASTSSGPTWLFRLGRVRRCTSAWVDSHVSVHLAFTSGRPATSTAPRFLPSSSNAPGRAEFPSSARIGRRWSISDGSLLSRRHRCLYLVQDALPPTRDTGDND